MVRAGLWSRQEVKWSKNVGPSVEGSHCCYGVSTVKSQVDPSSLHAQGLVSILQRNRAHRLCLCVHRHTCTCVHGIHVCAHMRMCY